MLGICYARHTRCKQHHWLLLCRAAELASEITHICRYPHEHGGLGLGEGKLLRNEVDCIDSEAICVMIVNQTTKPLRRFNTDLMYTVKTVQCYFTFD